MVRITSAEVKKRLGDVEQEKRFWCRDGRVLKSLQELEVALRDMGEETFRYHASEARNDFSKWVMDVIGDEKLSRDLSRSTTQTRAAESVAERIAWLRKAK